MAGPELRGRHSNQGPTDYESKPGAPWDGYRPERRVRIGTPRLLLSQDEQASAQGPRSRSLRTTNSTLPSGSRGERFARDAALADPPWVQALVSGPQVGPELHGAGGPGLPQTAGNGGVLDP